MKEFNKIIGYSEIKLELERIADSMLNQDKYRNLGVKTTRGLLINGKPGLGKTLMAKCLIKASKRKNFIIRKDMPDGEFVRYIKIVYEKAKKEAPSIVFLDDIDKFANEDDDHLNAEEFIAIQSCIDDCKDYEVFTLATANDTKCLPGSLLREGRFDKTITLYNPTYKDAEQIVKYYLKQKKISKDINYKDITRLLDGKSCATLETIINEAGIYSAYENRKEIEMKDIIKSFMRISYKSVESNNDFKNKYTYNYAIHEAGHALIAELLEPESVNLVTIKNHNGPVGGFTSFNQNKDYFSSKLYMENRVMALLAGKAATEVALGIDDIFCSDDISRAFHIIDRFVDDYCGYGFGNCSGYLEKPSEILINRKEELIIAEIKRYYQKTKQMLINNKDFLNCLTKELLNKNTIIYSDIQKIKKECSLVI